MNPKIKSGITFVLILFAGCFILLQIASDS